MKTLKPDFQRLKSSFSLLDINIGSVLKDSEDASALYIISGISFTEYALVRVYNNQDFNLTKMIKNSGLLPLQKNLYASNCIDPEAYVDCSKLVIRSFGVISNWLKKHPEQYLGQLHPKDQDILFQTISSATTIPKKLKKEFSFI